jgi:hypothetical protein
MIPTPLAAMGAYKQWMLYKIVANADGTHTKWPYDYLSNKVVSAHDPKYWLDYESASAIVNMWGVGYGLAFVFTDNDPFFFVDIDDCLKDSKWSPLALTVCSIFTGAAIEISPSGRGLHIYGMYSGVMPAHGCKANGIEFYHTGRFSTITGNGIIGNCTTDFTHLLPAFINGWVPPDQYATGDVNWTTEACEGYGKGLEDDDKLIEKALASKGASGAFGGRATFADLWDCNTEALHRFYPDQYNTPPKLYDASLADSALAQHLAFWTGKNCDRVRRLMGKSALARDKWLKHPTYMQRTITAAVHRCQEVYSVNKENLNNIIITPDGVVHTSGSNPFVTPDQQKELFAGCVYVQDIFRIMIPGGTFLKPEQFKVHFGGRKWVLDNGNTKIVDDAWQAFTQNQVYKFPQVESTAFKPLMEPGAVFNNGGKLYVNSYYPQEIKRIPGDPSILLNHLAKILPNERDRLIFLSYMAACVQHKGVKFQWAPLLQGVEGNGKTLFTRCVAEAIGGRYVHWPKASKLGNQFNGWMPNKLFYAVEDVYSIKNKYEIWEDLKPMITGGNGLEIEGKGADQISADVCGNFMFNSNHKDALPKTNNDRRIGIFFTAQQSAEDLDRDGMNGDYFQLLYNWCNADGFAIMAEYLHTFPIPDQYNPATKCQRAPETSTTRQAIEASRSGVEQEILNAIEIEQAGFAGGFVSSLMLDRLLAEIGVGRRLSINKRTEIVENLGYVTHPCLPEGRTPTIVMPDGGKTRLFVKKNSPLLLIVGAESVMEAYSNANN